LDLTRPPQTEILCYRQQSGQCWLPSLPRQEEIGCDWQHAREAKSLKGNSKQGRKEEVEAKKWFWGEAYELVQRPKIFLGSSKRLI